MVFFILPAMAQNPLQDTMLDSAMSAMHNLEYDHSLSLFNQMEDNIYTPIGKLLVEWYQMLGLYGNDFNKKILTNKCVDLADLYKQKLENDPNNPDLNFCMALAIGFKSRVMISEKNSFFVMFNGMNSLKYLRRVDELSENNPDLEFCKGVFEYYISKYPGIVKYCANMFLETTGGRETGRQRLELAAQSDGFLKYDANFLLAFLYLYIENKPEKAADYVDLLVTEFPKNPNYHFLQTFCNLQLENIDTAEQNFENFKKSINPYNPYYKEEFINRTDFLLAMIAIKKMEYDEADKYFDVFTQGYKLELEHLMAVALLEKGKIQENKGNPQEAKKLYKSVIEIGNNTYPIRLAEERLKHF